MNYSEAKAYLYSLRHHGASYGIDRMRLFAAALGNPETRFPSIHVAGTNGKGSVCAMLESIFRAAGYRTGLYTSPHLIRQGERIQINRTVLEEDAIAAYATVLRPVAEAIAKDNPDHHPSFFEFMTAMAFLHFADNAVDVGIFETGLGGRLDATNVLSPRATVITSIGLDHTEILGPTIEAIATEKAGILKPATPIVIGMLPPTAETVVRARAAQLGCPLTSIRTRFGPDPSRYPKTSLDGPCQRLNAATAVTTCETICGMFSLPRDAITRGLRDVHWPGRWEQLEVSGRQLILDCTHNEEGAPFLDQNLSRLRRKTGQRPAIITGTLGETRARALMPVVEKHAAQVWLIRPHQPRACTFDFLESLFRPAFRDRIHRTELSALFPEPGRCTLGHPGEWLVATGSIYLIGEIREAILCPVPAHQQMLQDLP